MRAREKLMVGVSNPKNRTSMPTMITILAAMCTVMVTKTLIIDDADSDNGHPGSIQEYVLTVAG
jgi:hypothetical protein